MTDHNKTASDRNHSHKEDDFREAMKDVTPLQGQNRVYPEPKRPKPRPRQTEADEQAVMTELLDWEADPADLETGEELIFLRNGVQPRVIRRLRRGYYSVADQLDLHQMNEATAKSVLMQFIDQSYRMNMSCIKVIHGKGLRSKTIPKLKNMANRVLRKHPLVMAFASCRPVDGGTGAVYVLLKKGPAKSS